MNGRWLVALAAVVVLLSMASGNVLLLRVGYALVAVVLVTIVLSWTSVRWVDIARNTRTSRTEAGGFCEESFTVANRGWIPKIWLEIQDHSDLPGHRASRGVPTLGPGRSRVWAVRTRCPRRGVYTLGPITLAGGDPLGMFRAERPLDQTTTFLVYPYAVPLPGFDIASGYLPGGPMARRRAQFTTTNVRTVRPYQPGDPYNRIHWRTTARRGRLYTKEFEVDPIADIWLLVDLDGHAQAGEAAAQSDPSPAPPWMRPAKWELDPSTEEYAVTIAASLGRRFLDAGKSVGLIAYGQRRVVLQADRGDRQLVKILGSLAVLRAVGNTSMAEVIAIEGRELASHMTLVCISPSPSVRWVEQLRQLRHRGISSMAVVLDASTFGPSEPSDAVLAALLARDIPARLVRCGDDLAEALRRQTVPAAATGGAAPA